MQVQTRTHIHTPEEYLELEETYSKLNFWRRIIILVPFP
jgi:hypothetical protein